MFRQSRPICSGVPAGDEVGPLDLALDDVAAERLVHDGGVFHVVENDTRAAAGQGFDRADRDVLAAAFGDDLVFLEAHVDRTGHGNFCVTVKYHVGLRPPSGGAIRSLSHRRARLGEAGDVRLLAWIARQRGSFSRWRRGYPEVRNVRDTSPPKIAPQRKERDVACGGAMPAEKRRERRQVHGVHTVQGQVHGCDPGDCVKGDGACAKNGASRHGDGWPGRSGRSGT